MQTTFLKHPYQSQQKPIIRGNIFQQSQQDHLPPIYPLERVYNHSYDLVGPQQVRNRILEQMQKQSMVYPDSLDNLDQKQSLVDLHKSMHSTIKRETVLSKFSQQQRKELTKELRNIKHYKGYQQLWNKESQRFRKETQKQSQPTLLQRSRKSVQVMPNPQKDEILKNYVNSYWQMSLRSNNVILKRYLKGNNRYDQNQLNEMLQRDEGIKEIQSSIPKLPLQKLKLIKDKELSLTGRNKLQSQSLSCNPSVISSLTSRLSKAHTDRGSFDKNQQILQMNYDSAHHWLKNQILY